MSSRNFRLYFVGQTISVSGTWMQNVAQGWLVLKLTHNSPVELSFVVALQWLPMLFFGSFGGLAADRSNKRTILLCTQVAAATLALVLGVLVSTHHDSIHVLFLLAGLLGIVNLFDNPARQSFVQEMVGRDLIANAISLNSVIMNSGRVIGPALAGMFLALVGVATCFYVNAASYITVIMALALMRTRELRPIETVTRTRGQLRLGLRYVQENPLLRDVLIATSVVGTFAFNFTITLPELSKVTFGYGGDAWPYTFLMTAMGVGAMIGGLFVAHRSRPTPRLLAVLAGLFGIFLSGVAYSPNVGIAIALMVPTGVASIAFLSTANALLQLNSAENMRGRVMSLYATGVLGTTPVGALIIGQVIQASDPRIGILIGSLLTIATGSWLLFAFGRGRTVEVVALA